MSDTPHFAYPFRIVGGGVAENEQGSIDDVVACVEAVLLTRPGDRAEVPDFGSPDLTFAQLPADPADLVHSVSQWEKRARLLAEERPDLFDETVLRVRLTVSLED